MVNYLYFPKMGGINLLIYIRGRSAHSLTSNMPQGNSLRMPEKLNNSIQPLSPALPKHLSQR